MWLASESFIEVPLDGPFTMKFELREVASELMDAVFEAQALDVATGRDAELEAPKAHTHQR